MESEFFAPLAELASAICKPKKTLENWTDADGKIKIGDQVIQTIKVGGTRVVARSALNDLIRSLLRQAGVSPDAAARLVSRQPEASEEVTSPSPALGAGAPRRRPGRPRDAERAVGGAK